jgi:hypothetical protein
MGEKTSIMVKGDISFLKLYNAIVRTGVKPLISLEGLRGAFIESSYNSIFFPIEVKGKKRLLHIKIYKNSEFTKYLLKYIPKNGRKLKHTTSSVIEVSLVHDELGIAVLSKLAYELAGGYIQLNDCGVGKDSEYQVVKGK